MQLFLLKNTRNWQRLIRQINCLIYVVSLFVAGMMNVVWIVGELCFQRKEMLFETLLAVLVSCA
ncbi:hypothetical protein EA537_15185 [Salmonella enterica]|nr:hypothetical protein [Salmonella enterica subsp. enterica serovar Oranienburg]